MSAHCCHGHASPPEQQQRDRRYRQVLWGVLGINAVMFLIELVAGLAAGSVSLQADALDFLADAGNYGISLWVIGMALQYRARAALAKGATMGLFGLWVFGALCSRNDVIGNLAVLLAALGVFGTGTAWPDISVAAVMAALALQGALHVIRQSLGELRQMPLTSTAAE